MPSTRNTNVLHKPHKTLDNMIRALLYQAVMLSLLLGTTACQHDLKQPTDQPSSTEKPMWKKEFSQQLPLLGHRNWILVVDQAYPLQSAAGIEIIDTQQPLKPVLGELLRMISTAGHIKPIIYTDLELNYLNDSICPGSEAARNDLKEVLKEYPLHTLLHEEVFGKLDQASKLFQVIVLKTTSRIPYSSVFIELDCGYWTTEGEQALRAKMKADAKP